jgi:hypothetical protein
MRSIRRARSYSDPPQQLPVIPLAHVLVLVDVFCRGRLRTDWPRVHGVPVGGTDKPGQTAE